MTDSKKSSENCELKFDIEIKKLIMPKKPERFPSRSTQIRLICVNLIIKTWQKQKGINENLLEKVIALLKSTLMQIWKKVYCRSRNITPFTF